MPDPKKTPVQIMMKSIELIQDLQCSISECLFLEFKDDEKNERSKIIFKYNRGDTKIERILSMQWGDVPEELFEELKSIKDKFEKIHDIL